LASATVENYVKTVYDLSQTHSDKTATTGRLADAMGVSPGTVTSMLKTLSELGLATYMPYEGARLTEEGYRLARRVYRRRALLKCFLCKSLDLDVDQVAGDAERMEHGVSDAVVARIGEYLGHPEFDPDGNPIPEPEVAEYQSEDTAWNQCVPAKSV